MQVVHPVAKLATNASGAIWWPYYTYDTFIAKDANSRYYCSTNLTIETYSKAVQAYWIENYVICRFMLGLKGPEHDKMDKTSQDWENSIC